MITMDRKGWSIAYLRGRLGGIATTTRHRTGRRLKSGNGQKNGGEEEGFRVHDAN
jgi:hypothetical protein